MSGVFSARFLRLLFLSISTVSVSACSTNFRANTASAVFGESPEPEDVSIGAIISATFDDTNHNGGVIAGVLAFTRPIAEESVEHYEVYWGDRTGEKISSAIVKLPKTEKTTSHVFSDVAVPESARTFLIYSMGAKLQTSAPYVLTFLDKGVPRFGAVAATLTDSDPNPGYIVGALEIVNAADESDITEYTVYWGNEDGSKHAATPYAVLAKTGGRLTLPFDGTTIPTGVTNIIVHTRNDYGERAAGLVLPIQEANVPTMTALGVSFADSDADAGEISGTVTIIKAADESDLTDYILYWGISETTRLSLTPIATIPKTGSDLSYAIAANTPVPTSATHFIVRTRNASGESVSGKSVRFEDIGLPAAGAVSLQFTDTDGDGCRLAGTIQIEKAANEESFSHYVLYWGQNATTKLVLTPIATLPKSGGNLSASLPSGTIIPAEATHLLVFSKNAYGEISTPTSLAIDDLGAVNSTGLALAFTDSDTTLREIQGNLAVTKANDEATLDQYAIYWGTSTGTKSDPTPIVTLAKTGANLTHSFTANSPVPANATHFLAYASRGSCEQRTPVSLAIQDYRLQTVAGGTAVGLFRRDVDVGADLRVTSVQYTATKNNPDTSMAYVYVTNSAGAWGSAVKSSLLNGLNIVTETYNPPGQFRYFRFEHQAYGCNPNCFVGYSGTINIWGYGPVTP